MVQRSGTLRGCPSRCLARPGAVGTVLDPGKLGEYLGKDAPGAALGSPEFIEKVEAATGRCLFPQKGGRLANRRPRLNRVRSIFNAQS